jgi:N-acetylglucosaminyl-diphospho-decaprenol L-rhamnosyltransferase
MSAAFPSVTVSIVSHGQWAMLRPLVDQLHAHCRGSVARIVLTVNVAEAADVPADWDLPLEIVRNATPRGFGANHNAAFAHCTSPWFLVLNPDIRLDGDVLAALLARARPASGLLTPRIHEPHKAAPEPYRGLLTPAELLRRRSPGHRPPRHPAWVAGMFMLLRAEAFAAVRGFDERFFMYCEDFDLCARLRLAGWELQVEESLSVLHDARRASNSSLRPLLWHLASFARIWTSPSFWRYAALLRRGVRA